MSFKKFGHVLAALLFSVTLTASAQNHSIRIEDGRVFIDGREQAAEDLPATLDVDGVNANLSFSGMTRFRIGDTTYAIEDGMLQEAASESDELTVFLGLKPDNHFTFSGTGAARERVWNTEPNVRTFEVYYDMLDSQVSALNEAREEFDQEQSLHVATRINETAEQAAIMVRAFPEMELRSYMEGVQERDQGLYDGILREHLMEMETRRLASQLLATPSASRRGRLRKELHAKLAEIFELKQTNRRAEIEQLDGRLRELRTQMDAREQNRNEIIERRIRQLLNELD
jgi:hypothetical protein